MKCAHDGCDHQADCAPKICVPAVNGPLDESKTIGIILGLTVCRQHFDELKIADFLTAQIKGAIEIVARGKAPPDFERAFFKRVLLISAEWATFERARAGRPASS